MTLRSRTYVVAVLLLFHAVTAAPAAETPSFTPYEFESAGGETVAAERGVVTVPETRSRPDGKQLELAFVRFPSTAAEPGHPIVYLAGGPGGSGIATARFGRFPLFMALRAYGDVIAFDQRGTGDSEADLSCAETYLVPFERALDRATLATASSDAARRCFEGLRRAGHDPSAYNTVESAADLMALRRVLGADKLVLWGISYGSHLALATLKLHGEHVDRAVLAGVEPLHHSWKLPSDQQALLEEISRLAAASPATRDVVPDLLGSIEKLLTRLEEEPVTVELQHPLTGVTMRVGVGKLDLQIALAGMLRGPAEFAALPDSVARMERGDWTGLALASAGQRMSRVSDGMAIAMDCASGQSRAWAERIEAEAASTLLGDAINLPFPAICEGTGVADLGDAFRSPVVSDVPALLISGTLDGRTPPANAEEVLPGLSRARHLVIEGAGHGDLFQSSPAILETIEAFVAGRPLPHERIRLAPVELIAPRRLAAVPDEVLERYVGEYRIDPDQSRRVVRAGSQLYTIRGDGPPFAIRPSSETEFFYEGSATWLRFELDEEGAAVAMVVHHDGAEEGERAVRRVD